MRSDNSSSFGANLRFASAQLAKRLGFAGSLGDAGPRRAVLIHLALLAVFGVWLPMQKGSEFLDSVILGSYACLGVLFAAPVAAAPFPEDARRATAAIARTLVCVGYGFLLTFTMLAMGLVIVYSTHTVFIGVDILSLVECLLFGVTLSLALTTIVVWTTVRFSAFAAKTVARFSFMGLLSLFFFWSRWLPDVALDAAGITGAVAAIGFALLLKLGSGSVEHTQIATQPSASQS